MHFRGGRRRAKPPEHHLRAEEPALKSLGLFPELIARLEKDTGINVEYRVQQALQPALSEEEAAALRATGEHWLDAQECRKARTFPELRGDGRGAARARSPDATALCPCAGDRGGVCAVHRSTKELRSQVLTSKSGGEVRA